jgi:hypothetical protein
MRKPPVRPRPFIVRRPVLKKSESPKSTLHRRPRSMCRPGSTSKPFLTTKGKNRRNALIRIVPVLIHLAILGMPPFAALLNPITRLQARPQAQTVCPRAPRMLQVYVAIAVTFTARLYANKSTSETSEAASRSSGLISAATIKILTR